VAASGEFLMAIDISRPHRESPLMSEKPGEFHYATNPPLSPPPGQTTARQQRLRGEALISLRIGSASASGPKRNPMNRAWADSGHG